MAAPRQWLHPRYIHKSGIRSPYAKLARHHCTFTCDVGVVSIHPVWAWFCDRQTAKIFREILASGQFVKILAHKYFSTHQHSIMSAMGDLWPHTKSPQLYSVLSVVQDGLIIYEKHSLVWGYSQILSRSHGEKSGELRRPGIIVHHGPEMWTRSVQRKSPTSPMLKYGSYRSRDLKLCRVTLTSECACVEWYGTCTTFVASFAGSPARANKKLKGKGRAW